MSRWIDAEWLIKESMPLSFSVQKWVNEVQIMTAPSIDIVHCGECKCCRDERIEEHMPLYIYCEKWNHETGFDDYCSAGERIDNDY